MLRLEALRNITSKILRSITCQILRKYTNYYEILCIRNIAMASETYEIFSRKNFAPDPSLVGGQDRKCGDREG